MKRSSDVNGIFIPSKKSRNGIASSQPGPSSGDSDFSNYPDGSIVRINLKNFMTHANFDWHPGPRINLITGVNGAGKSSILQAIVLGLGNL